METLKTSLQSTPILKPKVEASAKDTILDENSLVVNQPVQENSSDVVKGIFETTNSLSSDQPRIPQLSRSASAVTPAMKDVTSSETMHRR